MKDSYMLDSLDIDKPVHERIIERRMIECIKEVLLEFGQGFAFIGKLCDGNPRLDSTWTLLPPSLRVMSAMACSRVAPIAIFRNVM